MGNKGTPAYWGKNYLKFWIWLTVTIINFFFMTFSCAELRWDELIYITASLQGENLQDEYIQNIVFLYAVNINLNPVLLATYFQY